MSDNRGLLDYNQRGALMNCLALEDHLASLPPGINNSWCVKKHAMLACGHHLAEAVNHASRISPELGARYRALKVQAERVLRPGLHDPLPDLGEVATFRNSMRRAFGDPTLEESCSLCKKDGGVSGIGEIAPSAGISLEALVLATVAAGVAVGTGAVKNGKPLLLVGLGGLWLTKALQLQG